MPAMIMPFDVRGEAALHDLARGTLVRFTRMDAAAAWAEDVQVVPYQSVEQDPLAVRHLRLLRAAHTPARLRHSPRRVRPCAHPDGYTLSGLPRPPLGTMDRRGARWLQNQRSDDVHTTA